MEMNLLFKNTLSKWNEACFKCGEDDLKDRVLIWSKTRELLKKSLMEGLLIEDFIEAINNPSDEQKELMELLGVSNILTLSPELKTWTKTDDSQLMRRTGEKTFEMISVCEELGKVFYNTLDLDKYSKEEVVPELKAYGYELNCEGKIVACTGDVHTRAVSEWLIAETLMESFAGSDGIFDYAGEVENINNFLKTKEVNEYIAVENTHGIYFDKHITNQELENAEPLVFKECGFVLQKGYDLSGFGIISDNADWIEKYDTLNIMFADMDYSFGAYEMNKKSLTILNEAQAREKLKLISENQEKYKYFIIQLNDIPELAPYHIEETPIVKRIRRNMTISEIVSNSFNEIRKHSEYEYHQKYSGIEIAQWKLNYARLKEEAFLTELRFFDLKETCYINDSEHGATIFSVISKQDNEGAWQHVGNIKYPLSNLSENQIKEFFSEETRYRTFIEVSRQLNVLFK